MIFQRLQTQGFGKLSGEFNFAPEGMTLIVENNERGKSTLGNALFFALYGSPPVTASSEHPIFKQFELYRPWNSSKFQTKLDVLDGERSLIIERSFGDHPSVRVTERSSNRDVTEEFLVTGHDEVGFRLTGLNYLDAVRTYFTPQSLIPLGDTTRATLTGTIQRIADTVSGVVTAQAACASIEKTNQRFPFGNFSDHPALAEALLRIDGELSSLRERIQHSEQSRDNAVEMWSRAGALTRESAAMVEYHEEVRRRNDEIERNELSRRLAADDDLRLECEMLRERMRELEQFENTPLEFEAQILEARFNHLQQKNSIDSLTARLKEEQDRYEAARRPFAAMPEDALTETLRLEELRLSLRQLKEAHNELSELESRVEIERDRFRDASGGAAFEQDEQRWSRLQPEDEEFIIASVSQLRLLNRTLSQQEQERLAATQEIARWDREMAEAGGAGYTTPLISGSVIAGIGVLIAIVFQPVILLILGILLFLAGAATVGAVLATQKKKMNELGSQRTARLAQVDQLNAATTATRSELEELTNRLNTIASKLELTGYRDLFSAVQRRRALSPFAFALRNLIAHLARWREKREEYAKRVIDQTHAFGANPPANAKLSELITICDRIEVAARAHAETAAVRTRLQLLEEQIAAGNAACAALEENLATILRRTGLPDHGTLEERIDRYRENCRLRRERFDIVQKQLPLLEEQLLPGVELERLRNLKTHLSARLSNQPVRDLPAIFANLDGDVALTQIERERQNIERERASLEARVFDFLRDWREVGELRRRESKMLRLRDRLVKYESASRLAIEELTNAAKLVHFDWSSALNELATRHLTRFGGTFSAIRFNHDLSLEVVLESGRILREHELPALSVGARDQIYIAVRIAISEFLSNSNPLPVVMDEPFSQADEDRFHAGMELLLSVGEQRQIILLTCHALRHSEWLKANAGKVSLVSFAA